MAEKEAAATISTLQGMLAQLLEQTNALWRAQASTNEILDELRRSIPAAQETTKVRERLRRVEAFTETLASGQLHVDLHPHRETGHRTATSGEDHPGSSLGIHVIDREALGEEAPPSGHISRSTADPIVSPEQKELPALPCVLAATPIIEKTEEPGHQIASSVSSGPDNISFGGASHTYQRQSDAERETSISPVRESDKPATVEPTQSFTQIPTSKGDPAVTQRETGQTYQSCNEERGHDDKSQSLFQASKAAMKEPDKALRSKLADLVDSIEQITPLRGENKDPLKQKPGHMKEECTQRLQELLDMVLQYFDSQITEMLRKEHHRQASEAKQNMQEVFDEVRAWAEGHGEMIQTLLEGMRADSQRQNEEIVSAVRATANEQVPFNVEGYLEEFSHILSTEVRMLLSEVGKLREERRNIQHEIGYLMMMQSTFDPSGEFGTDRRPPEEPSFGVEPSWPLQSLGPVPAPAWRSIPTRKKRRPPRPERPVNEALSWALWPPDPDPQSPGLFGPSSPRDSHSARTLSSDEEESDSSKSSVRSWVTWQPDPERVRAPPPVENTSYEPLFGSAWPRDLHPTPSMHSGESDSPSSGARSWATWQPDPRFAPTPPPVEPSHQLLDSSPTSIQDDRA